MAAYRRLEYQRETEGGGEEFEGGIGIETRENDNVSHRIVKTA